MINCGTTFKGAQFYLSSPFAIRSSDVCEAIVSIAREFELLVVAEDVYNMLTYDAGSVAPKRLLAFDRMSDADYKGNVISNGTFSKILSPGARLGWLELPPRCMRLVSRSGIMHSGGALNNYTSGIVMSALQLDLVEDILKDNIEVYGVSILRFGLREIVNG